MTTHDTTSRRSPATSVQLQYLTTILILPDGQRREVRIDYGCEDKDVRVLGKLHGLSATSSENTEASPAPSVPSGVSRTDIGAAVKDYVSSLLTRGRISKKTADEYLSSLTPLPELLPVKDLRQVTHEHVDAYIESLKKLPSNARKKFPGASTAELLQMEGVPCISAETINHRLTRAASFFNWARDRGLIEKNPFRNAKVRDDRHDEEKRASFDRDELRRIFLAVADSSDSPFKFWIPVLALLSGCRQNELAQLYVSDIETVEGVPVIQIRQESDRKDKKLKSRRSRRTVPIHSIAIELGFLEFVEQQRNTGADRLFPELKKSRDGYGQQVSKWFNRTLRKKAGITVPAGGPKKDFHSFRHTISAELRQHGRDTDEIGSVLGHESRAPVTDRYAKQHPIGSLRAIIESYQPTLPLDELRNRATKLRSQIDAVP